MKRLLFIATGFFLLLIAFTSCKRKDYTCHCVVSTGGLPVFEDLPLGLVSNNKAQKKCNDYQVSRTSDFRGTTNQLKCQVIIEE